VAETYSSLDILCTQPYSGKADLPSWCPDWREYYEVDIGAISDAEIRKIPELGISISAGFS
jgi:hypothetical protein